MIDIIDVEIMDYDIDLDELIDNEEEEQVMRKLSEDEWYLVRRFFCTNIVKMSDDYDVLKDYIKRESKSDIDIGEELEYRDDEVLKSNGEEFWEKYKLDLVEDDVMRDLGYIKNEKHGYIKYEVNLGDGNRGNRDLSSDIGDVLKSMGMKGKVKRK